MKIRKVYISEKIKQLHDLRYEKYLFLQFLIWVSFPLIIMTVITNCIYVQSENEKSSYMLEAYAEQVLDTCSNYFGNVKEYYLDIVNGEEYQVMLEKRKAPYDSLMELAGLQEKLKGGRFADYVDSYSFINVKNEWVMSNYGMYDFLALRNEDEVRDFVNYIDDSAEDVVWMNNLEKKSCFENGVKYGYIDLSGSLLVLKTVNFQGEMEGVLVLRLRMNELESRINVYKGLGYETMVFAQDKILLGEDCAYAKAVEKKGENIISLNAEKMRRYRIKEKNDTMNGLQYRVIFDKQTNLNKMWKLLGGAMVFLCFYIMLLLILRKVTNRVSEPFWKLENQNAVQAEKLKKLFVINLMKGVWEEEKISMYMDKYEWQSCKGYRLIMLYPYSEEEEKEKFLDRLIDRLTGNCYIVPVKYKECVAAIVGGEDEMQVEYKVAQLYRMASDFTRETLHSHIVAGISNYFTSLMDCGMAVGQCLEAISLKEREAKEVESGDFVWALYDDFSLKNVNTGGNAKDIEVKLWEAMRERNREKAYSLLKELLEEGEKQQIWGLERVVSVYGIVIGMLEFVQKENVPLKEVFAENNADVLNMKEYIYDNKKLEKFIYDEIIVPIINKLERNKNSVDMNIVNKALRMIKESRGDLTLTECAERIGCHPSYLSRVIKKEKGISFLDVVNNAKMERIKHLLMDTAISVSEIAEMTGYNNTQNFIRFFKNQEGITPARYRKEKGNEK